jgi:acyl carrier protein
MVSTSFRRSGGDSATPDRAAMLGHIQCTWAEILELDADQIGSDVDFFEFGGDSLMAASAVALLSERVGLAVPVRALFAAPTPHEMADVVAELHPGADRGPVDGTTPFLPAWVIPLQRRAMQALPGRAALSGPPALSQERPAQPQSSQRTGPKALKAHSESRLFRQEGREALLLRSSRRQSRFLSQRGKLFLERDLQARLFVLWKECRHDGIEHDALYAVGVVAPVP